jgi:hypothetical protein
MSKKPGAFSIRFQTITCERCSTKRIRGVTCPACGQRAAEWEIDQDMLKRRRLVGGLLDKLDARPETEPPAPWQLTDEVFQEFLDLHDPLFNGLQEVNQPDGTGEALSRFTDDFVDLRTRIERTQHRRPHIALAISAASGIHHIEQVLRHYLAALQVPTPIEAQRHGDQAQSHLDQAGNAAAALAERRDSLDQIEISSSGAMLHSMLAARMERTGETPLEMFANAEGRVAELLSIQPNTGYELPFLLAEDIASVELDAARFTKTYVEAFHLLHQHASQLAAIAQATPELIVDLVDAQISIFDSCWKGFHSIRNAQTTRQAAEAMLDLQSELVEAPGALVVRTFLLVLGLKTKPYAKLKAGNATEDLRDARRDPRLAPLLEGLDDHLRTAKSHHTVRYTERSVIATTASRGSLEYDHDHLIDLVLEGLESTLACMLALRQALDQAGVDVDDETLPEEMGIPLVELAAITLGIITGVDTHVTINDGEILVEVVGDLQSGLVSLAVALGPALSEARRFRIVHEHEGRTRELTGPTTAIRSWSKRADDFDDQLQLMRLCLRLRVNGVRAVDRDQLRTWSSAMAIDALHERSLGSAESRAVIVETSRRIRCLIQLAQEAGDPELEALMRESMRWVRTNVGNQTVVERLNRWRFAGVDWNMP